MNRPRNRGNKHLTEGLYPPAAPGRCWRIRHPLTGKIASLKTKDEDKARKLHSILYPRFLEEKLRAESEAIQKKLEALGTKVDAPRPTQPKTAGTVSALALEMVPLIPTFTTDHHGEERPLSRAVQATYRQTLARIEKDQTGFGQRLVRDFSDPDNGPQWVRAYLAQWLEKKSMYNTVKGILSRLFDRAIDQGVIARNPCDPIKSKKTPVRTVYIPDDHYITITAKLATEYHEVYAKCCDLMYLLSARNTDALTLEESEVTLFETPQINARGEEVWGLIQFLATKNQQDVDMDINKDLRDLLLWFRAYKRREGVISNYFCIHPIRRAKAALTGITVDEARSLTAREIGQRIGMTKNAWLKRVNKYGGGDKGIAAALAEGAKGDYACSRALAGKPIQNAHLRDRFNDAKAAAGLGDVDYTLRDLRPKGITDEARLAGGERTNKGGWKPGSDMEGRYVKVRLPVRTANNLRVLR